MYIKKKKIPHTQHLKKSNYLKCKFIVCKNIRLHIKIVTLK